ncbi:MAG TPA: DUF2218 domain-containing protein [Sphingomicrobium sp.]
MNTLSAAAVVPTSSASRYLQQLAKHWSHKFPVEFTPTDGSITFPKDVKGAAFARDAIVKLHATDAALEVRVEASEPAQLEGVKGAVASHLDRFAFREAPLPFDWR